MPPTETPRPPHHLVRTLPDRLRRRGRLVGGVVLDRGFDRGDAIRMPPRRGRSDTVPRRPEGRGTDRRNPGSARPSGTPGAGRRVTGQSRREVPTRVRVWERSGRPRARVSAFGGRGSRSATREARRAWLARRRDRERFGSGTGGRQKNQARAWTTSGHVADRLRPEGRAPLRRPVRVRLTERVARSQHPTPKVRVALRVGDLPETLADPLKARYPSAGPTILWPKPLEQDAAR